LPVGEKEYSLRKKEEETLRKKNQPPQGKRRAAPRKAPPPARGVRGEQNNAGASTSLARQHRTTTKHLLTHRLLDNSPIAEALVPRACRQAVGATDSTNAERSKPVVVGIARDALVRRVCRRQTLPATFSAYGANRSACTGNFAANSSNFLASSSSLLT
jgi:hypothetical protein